MISFYSTLTEALDRCKRKYQAKLRKTEQQMIAVIRGGTEAKNREEEDPKSGKKTSASSQSAGDQTKTPKTSSSKIPLPRLEGKALWLTVDGVQYRTVLNR